MLDALATVAPGHPLREGLDRILQANMGALIVVGDGPEVLAICSGGFLMDAEFTPQRLSELAKMDGAIILAKDASRIARANVHLVDTAPRGVTEINRRGVVHDGVEYPLDVLIYATGFSWMATSTFNMVIGRGGRSLSHKWSESGTSTFLGLHSNGFPNLFIVTGPPTPGGASADKAAVAARGRRRGRGATRFDVVR